MRAIRAAVAAGMGVGLVAGVAGCSQTHAAVDHPTRDATVVASTTCGAASPAPSPATTRP